jgi:hypothetical protein
MTMAITGLVMVCARAADHTCRGRGLLPVIRSFLATRRGVIILCVRWYLRFKLSLRDLVEMMAERGLSMAHTTIMRWVQQYAPELRNAGNGSPGQSVLHGESTRHT